MRFIRYRLTTDVQDCLVLFQANAFDSRLRGDLVPLGSSPKNVKIRFLEEQGSHE